MKINLVLLYLKYIKRLTSSWQVIEFACRRYKNKTFLIDPDAGVERTFGQLQERIEKAALFLSAQGLQPNDTVACSVFNCHEFFEIRAACHRMGLVFFGIPPHLSDDVVAYFITQSAAKLVFCRHRYHVTGIAVRIVDLDSKEYADIFACPAKNVPAAKPGDLATFNVSSGTTQKIPKIVQLTDANWMASLFGYLRNSNVPHKKKTVFLCTVSFLAAGSAVFLPAFLEGLTFIIFKASFNVEALADTIRKYKVTRLYITPSRLMELQFFCVRNNVRLDSLETIITGTEAMPALRLKEAVEYFGPIIYVGYGMVEALPPLALLTPKEYHAGGSVGRVSFGVQVKITDEGKVAIKGPTVSRGYLNNPVETGKCFEAGWFYTSDYGFFDRKGFLHIKGRKEELLARSPRLVFASEIEEQLYELPFINRCAAVLKNGKIILFVSLRQLMNTREATQAILQKFQETDLGRDVPEIVLRERLPINALGKLDRIQLIG